MANINDFRAVAPKVWQLLGELEDATGITVENVKYVRYSNKGSQIFAYIDERRADIAVVHDGMRTAAALFGVDLDVSRPYMTVTQLSGSGVTLTVLTEVEGLPLRIIAMLDGEQHSVLLEARRLLGVAA